MLIWVILLAFGVPAFVVVRDVIRKKAEHKRKLEDIQNCISEKNENTIADKVKAIKLKRKA